MSSYRVVYIASDGYVCATEPSPVPVGIYCPGKSLRIEKSRNGKDWAIDMKATKEYLWRC